MGAGVVSFIVPTSNGGIVRRGLLLSLSVLVGCSGQKARPDAESWPAPPVISGAALDTGTILVGPAPASDGEGEAAVLFRCEQGKLGAYLVPGTAGDEGLVAEQMVPISLDSAPSC